MPGKSTGKSTAPTPKTRAGAAADATAKPRRRKAAAPDLLDGLPDALYQLALRTGDVRKVRKIGPAAVELDIADARALGLV